MRNIMIAILAIVLLGLIITILWPAIMATIGAIIACWSLKKFLSIHATGEKVLYAILIAIGALIVLANLKGAVVIIVVAAIFYFLTKNNRPTKRNNNKSDTFDYPYNK